MSVMILQFRRIAVTFFLLYGRNTNNNNSIQAFSSSSSSSAASSVTSSSSSLPLSSTGTTPYYSNTATATATATSLRMSSNNAGSSSTTTTTMTWEELKTKVSSTSVGRALDLDSKLRKEGRGSPHVHNQLRLFDDDDDEQQQQQQQLPSLTLYRDHAGWCPYCQKTMLLIEAKEIPLQIELVNMRSYGDKPNSFLQKVPNGMLPALEDTDSGQVALDSAYIMEFLEKSHPSSSSSSSTSYKQMVPSQQDQPEQYQRYQSLMNLERELFRWWCTLMFRSEQPNGGNGNPAAALMGNLFGNNNKNKNGDDDDDDDYVSSSMQGFLDCLETVDAQLRATKGPYFLDYTTTHPTMIDFVYASHIERMLASCAYWKGMDLRNKEEYQKLDGLRGWMDALEKHDYYLAFKSDYYTHVKDIPPQYGPSSAGVSRFSKIERNKNDIEGNTNSNGNGSSNSWKLPLEDDEKLQPLFRGIPLPRCVLDAVEIQPDDDGSYITSSKKIEMKTACQFMAAWKLCGNGSNIARFAARGGPKGSKNIRKTFGAELADPYAEADDSLVDIVDEVLRVIAAAMLSSSSEGGEPNSLPGPEYVSLLQRAVDNNNDNNNTKKGVASSLAYLRDRIGVPRDLPLASARYLRAYLNWAIDSLA